jgi:hypothetical protein
MLRRRVAVGRDRRQPLTILSHNGSYAALPTISERGGRLMATTRTASRRGRCASNWVSAPTSRPGCGAPSSAGRWSLPSATP